MCEIWDWQSTIVKDLNDSQDPKHTLFCRDLLAFFRQQMSVFYPFRGGDRPKRTLSAFFTVFLVGRLPLVELCYVNTKFFSF